MRLYNFIIVTMHFIELNDMISINAVFKDKIIIIAVNQNITTQVICP